jgi:FKBP-type peptidyl-prolyl cis-trans isomerase SlyD
MNKPNQEQRVHKDSVVTLCYKLCNSQYKILEERTATDPLVFIQGYDRLLPAVELAIEGQSVGYQTAIKLAHEQAYGSYLEDLVSEVPRNQFAENLNLKIGMKFDTLGPSGKALVVRIINIEEDLVTLDGNHPLAGQDLIFEINILAVRMATDEEINPTEDESGQEFASESNRDLNRANTKKTNLH